MSLDWRGEPQIRPRRPADTAARWVALFLLGVVLLNPPTMSIFSVDRMVLGMPLFYVYLFAVWAGLIALVRLATRGSEEPPGPPTETDGG
jgi:hypothetical protein